MDVAIYSKFRWSLLNRFLGYTTCCTCSVITNRPPTCVYQASLATFAFNLLRNVTDIVSEGCSLHLSWYRTNEFNLQCSYFQIKDNGFNSKSIIIIITSQQGRNQRLYQGYCCHIAGINADGSISWRFVIKAVQVA